MSLEVFMRISLTILIIFFINFGAVAKETIYKCANSFYIKVENPLIGKRMIFYRTNDGIWSRVCLNKGSKITKDSFKCVTKNLDGGYLLLDEVTKQLKMTKLGKKDFRLNCTIENKTHNEK